MKRNSDFMWSLYLVGTAVLFFYLGTLLGSFQTERNLQQEILDREGRIQILEWENQQISKELTSRGIYSYPRASILSNQVPNHLSILIMLNGNEPLEDLVVKRITIPNYSQITTQEAAKSTSTKNSAYLGNLKSHTPAAIEVPLDEKEAAMEFSFESGKTSWKQYIRAKKNAAGEIFTFWIITNGNNVIIDKHIDEGFPVEEDGSILLWENRKIKYSEIEMNSIFEEAHFIQNTQGNTE